MTTKPYTFTDESGDLLHVSTCRTGLHLVAEIVAEEDAPSFRAPVCFPAASVREVTSAMHEKAGLPDRWAALKDIIFCLRPDGMSGEAYRTYVVESMARLEAGQ